MRHIAIDAFAGGGGASEGLHMAGVDVSIAINHDPEAIRMHTVNHPKALHLTEDVFRVNLADYLRPDDVVDVMWASPDCTSHSKAKGGQPRNRGLRVLPWAVYRMCKQIRDATGALPKILLMENVEEIQDWGPLDEHGYRIQSRRGEDYRKFVRAMKGLGFEFDCRTLVAADYGAPTTRKRWYAVLRSDGGRIRFPQATHSKMGGFGLKKWHPVSECIDFSDLGESIFSRKKPLAEATLKRIANGIRKYILENPDPFILPDGTAMPFLVQYHGETKDGEARGQTLAEPLKTIDTSNRYGLASVILDRDGAGDTHKREAVAAFLVKYYGTGCGQTMDAPLGTITTKDRFGMVSCLLKKGDGAFFLTKFYGLSIGQGMDEPIGALTTFGHYGLIECCGGGEPEAYGICDIRFRMLKPEELKRAQGFPGTYVIDHDADGRAYPKSEQVAKIGNSVVPLMAAAIARANLDEGGMTA
ncbi:DNA cytosine methyltransferase [Stomatobaculum longum]|uniref:DNA cytosine methyltransferase n=1 Tax=Stomatobaculum longum TaxID=796942 RepID=UPI0028DB3368|nr:DNA cytosine methyltransferase [Stomatobaculum longum]